MDGGEPYNQQENATVRNCKLGLALDRLLSKKPVSSLRVAAGTQMLAPAKVGLRPTSICRPSDLLADWHT